MYLRNCFRANLKRVNRINYSFNNRKFYSELGKAKLKEEKNSEMIVERLEKNSDLQRRAALTEEYMDLNEKDGSKDEEFEEDEYYIDCSNIEERWLTLTYEVQQDVISYLNIKQEFGWMYLTEDEKKAIYYISYGKWGPRDTNVMNLSESIFKLMTSGLLFVAVGFSLVNYMNDRENVEKLEKSEDLDCK